METSSKGIYPGYFEYIYSAGETQPRHRCVSILQLPSGRLRLSPRTPEEEFHCARMTKLFSQMLMAISMIFLPLFIITNDDDYYKQTSPPAM